MGLAALCAVDGFGRPWLVEILGGIKMTDQAPAPTFTRRETEFEAMVRVRRDRPPAETVAALVAEGHPPAQAEAAVRKVFEGQVAERRKQGGMFMLVGAICFIAGVGLSLWMTLGSSNTSVFTWGIVLFGIIQFGYGAVQFLDARPQAPAPTKDV